MMLIYLEIDEPEILAPKPPIRDSIMILGPCLTYVMMVARSALAHIYHYIQLKLPSRYRSIPRCTTGQFVNVYPDCRIATAWQVANSTPDS